MELICLIVNPIPRSEFAFFPIWTDFSVRFQQNHNIRYFEIVREKTLA